MLVQLRQGANELLAVAKPDALAKGAGLKHAGGVTDARITDLIMHGKPRDNTE
jgi:hypothetical protein